MDEIIATLNSKGNYDLLIPNIGYEELKEQAQEISDLWNMDPTNENIAVIGDILCDSVKAIEKVRKNHGIDKTN